MKVTITPAKLHGSVKAVASKSEAHRLLICAALSDRPTDIACEELSRDIEATAGALRQMGADITYDRSRGVFHVVPLCPGTESCTLDAGESGSTLRFLLPVICALGIRAHIRMSGRLSKRPLSPLWEELIRHGCTLIRESDGSVSTSGKLCGGEFRIAADVSSQFVSGLLFALPLLSGPSCIRLCGQVESEGYIKMTIHALDQFGLQALWDKDNLTVSGKGYCSPGAARAEGDWSNGAFWEIAGMLEGTGSVVCTGLDEASEQPDRAVRQLKDLIAQGNAKVDSRNIPDLVPVLAVLASVSPGTTDFTHAERLRLKESDRIRSVVNMINALGGYAEETKDGLTVRGVKQLRGGCVDSFNDHRIAMSAAIASAVCRETVVISSAEAVNKSYPSFWEDLKKLGGNILIEQ